MKILYFDCFSGISGDMTLGALLDLAPQNFDYLTAQLKTLHVHGWDITRERRNKNGINANYIKVILPELHEHEHSHEHSHSHEHTHHSNHSHEHEHRTLPVIISLIEESGITPGAKKLAVNIFKRLAKAEAKIHGTEVENVSFHEVGAVDSIIDTVGCAVLLDLLAAENGIEKICCSAVNDGHGFTYCQHGKIPVPAPAVVEVFAEAYPKIKSKQVDIPKELVTPTGAAIIAEIAESSGEMPEMQIIKTGYGAGTRDLEIPNVLRVILGETAESSAASANSNQEQITVIETNIDDCPPEILAYTLEKLLKAGANDAFFTPVYMKKNRPAVKLTVLCKSESTEKLADIIFAETTAIGVRIREERRICLPRQAKIINTEYGSLTVKEVEFNGGKKITPEFEEAKKLAESLNVPLYKVYESVYERNESDNL
jgi:uncharacterized protein (TIGR00299 family) protein